MLPGCRVITLGCHRDTRGALYPLDLRGVAGFDASRLFVVIPPDTTEGLRRGGHANSTPEPVIAVAGRVVIDIDAGTARATLVLDHPGLALLVGPGVVIHLRDFAPGTALLHKLADGRTAPVPGQTYPLTFVTGMPSAVWPFSTATRTWHSAT